MIFSDKDIKRLFKAKKIIIDPEPDWEKQLGACALDLRLEKVEGDKKNLGTREFCLALTTEYLELPDDICGMLHGRSSLGRKGLMIHSTAPLIEAGFKGKLVLELYNAGAKAIRLETGTRICAVSFEKLSSPAEKPYYKKGGAKYLGQKEINS